MNVSKVRNAAVAAAVATALGGVGTAFAATLTTPSVVFYMAGGSAEPQPVQAALCQLLSNVDVVTDVTGTISATNINSSDYLVVEGTATNAIGSVAAGTEVMVMYKFNGGSYLNGAASFGSAGGTLTYPTVASVLTGTVITKAQGGTTTTGGAASGCIHRLWRPDLPGHFDQP